MLQASNPRFTVPCVLIVTEIGENTEDKSRLVMKELVKAMNLWGSDKPTKPQVQLGSDLTDAANPRVLGEMVTEQDTIKMIGSLYSEVDVGDLVSNTEFVKSFFGKEKEDMLRGEKLIRAMKKEASA
jgi:hypothetical protein